MSRLRFTKEQLEQSIENSLNFSQALRFMKMNTNGSANHKTIKKYVKLWNIDTSHFLSHSEYMKKLYNDGIMKPISKRDIKTILVRDSDYMSSHNLKNRLYNENIKKSICEMCGQDENWKGKKMSLILDHINGISNDNRIENLRIVCPNCNATLPTHCSKNRKDKKYKDRKKSKQRAKKEMRKVERPPFDVLLDEIKSLGYVGTGKKYNVSDNAIRKWVKCYEKYGE